MPLIRSWVTSANSSTTAFPLNNLPHGVFSGKGIERHCGIAIGSKVLDLTALEQLEPTSFPARLTQSGRLFDQGSWNLFITQGACVWTALRSYLTDILAEDFHQPGAIEPFLIDARECVLHLPFEVCEFTDFYSSKHHASNVGTMLRGAENALPPNWLHMPIGYNGRASSVIVSGTDVQRPWGQLKAADKSLPAFLPSRRFDFELELGAIVGQASSGPVDLDEADAMIFGYVLLNDWSARDIQAWEYQPLGPFQAKATATTISPWIVQKAAIEPFRVTCPEREFELLDHLKDRGPMLYDIALSVSLAPQGKAATTVCRTNYSEMYYSAAQQLVHHASSGCPMRTGDLLGSGTISGPEPAQYGSMLELSWGGKAPLVLDTGDERSFLLDGDTVTLSGESTGDGYRIGFGECTGRVIAAGERPC